MLSSATAARKAPSSVNSLPARDRRKSATPTFSAASRRWRWPANARRRRRQPLAIVVSFGLVISTALTLLVIPVVYDWVPSTVRTKAEDEALDAVVEEAERLARAADPAGTRAAGEAGA